MKNTLRFLLCLLLIGTLAVGTAAGEDAEFVVGSPTAMSGHFFSEAFGTNTADIDARALLHGYNLIHWDESQGVYVFDTSVVQTARATTDQAGNRVYTIDLYEDLTWSDGTPITAWDYAFSFLLTRSPEMAAIGARRSTEDDAVLGTADYADGKASFLAGVGVTGEYRLVVTLDGAVLPYFYEMGLLLCNPYPISEIAPGCKVYVDGADENDPYGMGVYIGSEDRSAKSAFTADLLRSTVLDPENGYDSHPKTVSGPYVLTAFDGTTAHFEINPHFKGALKKTVTDMREPYGIWVDIGDTQLQWKSSPARALVKPTIRRIAFTLVHSDTMMDDLKAGRVHLINKVVLNSAYETGMNAVRAGSLRYTKYPREGLAFVNFSYGKPAMRETAVRQAIAWCMDRDALTSAYCGKNGVRVDGYYGMEQWEYLLASHRMGAAYNFVDEVVPAGVTRHLNANEADWTTLKLDLTVYRVDTGKANRLLDDAGWTLNAEGGAYDAAKDDVRCKMVDGELVRLDLVMIVPEGNRIVDTMQENFTDNLAACGVRLTVVPTPMSDLLAQYYGTAERTSDMIYLASNFSTVADPSTSYAFGAAGDRTLWNTTYTDDEELYRLGMEMRRTSPAQTFEYVKKWVAFQKRYNEVLPSLPVYSNIYHDFYTPALRGYHPTAHVTWSQAILEAAWTPAAK